MYGEMYFSVLVPWTPGALAQTSIATRLGERLLVGKNEKVYLARICPEIQFTKQ